MQLLGSVNMMPARGPQTLITIAVIAIIESIAIIITIELLHMCLQTAEKRGVNITPYENKLFEAEQALRKPLTGTGGSREPPVPHCVSEQLSSNVPSPAATIT